MQNFTTANEGIAIPTGTRLVMIAENVSKKIRYEYVNTQNLKKADFIGERPTESQSELQKLILKEGIPYIEEVGNFWCGVPDVPNSTEFRCNELEEWAKNFDSENGSMLGNIHQYALYLATRVINEGWDAVADEADKIYKRYRIVKDHRAKSGFSWVGGRSNSNYIFPASVVSHFYFPVSSLSSIVAWVVLSK